MRHKLGLKHSKHTLVRAKKMLAMAMHLDVLGPPPLTSFPWYEKVEEIVGGPDNWGMFLNDTLSDCVVADDLHFEMVKMAHIPPFQMPTDAEARLLYTAVAGWDPNDPSTDQGTDPSVNLAKMEQTGTYANGGEIDITSPENLMWACHVFGGVRMCINCPDIADGQFDAGLWDYNGEPFVDQGGHDIRCVGYERDTAGNPLYHIVTWGRRIQMTHEFWGQFGSMVEADVVPQLSLVAGVIPDGMDLNRLLAHLEQVS